jgi:hypothetical protein
MNKMQRMMPEYAQKLLDGGYAFYNNFFSYHDGLLVVIYSGAERPYRDKYYATQLEDGNFVLDEKGYVSFSKVEPIIDEHTRFQFS